MPILGFPALFWTWAPGFGRCPTCSLGKTSSREGRLKVLPVNRDETDAKTFCHLIVEARNISYATQTQEYDKRIAR